MELLPSSFCGMSKSMKTENAFSVFDTVLVHAKQLFVFSKTSKDEKLFHKTLILWQKQQTDQKFLEISVFLTVGWETQEELEGNQAQLPRL